MADLQALADEFHSAHMRKIAATEGLSADVMLIGRILADQAAAKQRLRDAAERERGFDAALSLILATWTRASDDYSELPDAKRKQLLVDDSAIASARKPRQRSTRTPAAPAEDSGAQRTSSPIALVNDSAIASARKPRQRLTRTSAAPAKDSGAQRTSSPIALATAIIQNARAHPVTWGLGHPRYDRFTYLPNGHRDLPNDAPSAFYDTTGGRFTERDHLVGLAQAHESGAAYWSRETRQAFALDPDNIYSITPATNTEKSYRDPAEWLPADPSVHKRYAAEWVLIKTRWSLTYDEAELAALRRILNAETNG